MRLFVYGCELPVSLFQVMPLQPPVLPTVTSLLAGALVAMGAQEHRPALNLLPLLLSSLRQSGNWAQEDIRGAMESGIILNIGTRISLNVAPKLNTNTWRLYTASRFSDFKCLTWKLNWVFTNGSHMAFIPARQTLGCCILKQKVLHAKYHL